MCSDLEIVSLDVIRLRFMVIIVAAFFFDSFPACFFSLILLSDIRAVNITR